MDIESRIPSRTRKEILFNYSRITKELEVCQLLNSLIAVSKVASAIFKDRDYHSKLVDGQANQLPHLWVLAFVANELILTKRSKRHPRVLDRTIYNRIADIYYTLLEPLARSKTISAPIFTILTSFEQFFWQDPIYNLIPRYHMIATHYENESSSVRSLKDEFNSMFTSMSGMGIEDYLRLGMFCWMATSDGKPFKRDFILNGNFPFCKLPDTADKLDLFLESFSTSKNNYRSTQSNNRQSVLRKYFLNPLLRHPMVIVNNVTISPIPQAILYKATHGTYFDMLDYSISIGNSDTHFPSIFGHLFNDYVGRLLATKYIMGNQLYNCDEYNFGSYKGRRPDWLIMTETSITVVEVKSTRIPRYLAESLDLEQVQEFFDSRFISGAGVAQLVECMDYFREKYPSRQVKGMVVTPEPFPFFNFMRGYFDDGDERVQMIEHNRIQFFSIDELEMLVENEEADLPQILERKTNSIENLVQPMAAYLSHKADKPDYRSARIFDHSYVELFGCDPRIGTCDSSNQ